MTNLEQLEDLEIQHTKELKEAHQAGVRDAIAKIDELLSNPLVHRDAFEIATAIKSSLSTLIKE